MKIEFSQQSIKALRPVGIKQIKQSRETGPLDEKTEISLKVKFDLIPLICCEVNSPSLAGSQPLADFSTWGNNMVMALQKTPKYCLICYTICRKRLKFRRFRK